MPSSTRIIELISRLRPFQQLTAPIFEWLSCVGNIDEAILYSQVFWPEFVECFDLIFLNRVDNKLYEQWMATLGGDRQRLQRVLNHRHIADLFANSASVVTKEKAVLLGGILKEIWEVKLSVEFPSRSFRVFVSGHDSVDPVDVAIEMFEECDKFNGNQP